ncbi:hypothetical protein Tco_1367614 [Tanacetum coccineum]
MSSITAQQAKLDLELVPKEKRLEIGKCNRRLNLGKIQREPTFQVVLDALALPPCYSAFLITVDVPEVYMHQFWDSVYKHDTFYRFKMDKRKRFKLILEIFRDIFKICPRVHGQDFDALPTDEEIMYFLRELVHTWEINSLNEVVVDQMHQHLRTFVALINKSLSGKTTGLDKLRLSIAQILLATQIYGAILLESLTSPEMKETKAYKTYLGFATGATPPKITRKFKKASPSKKDVNLSVVPMDKEPKSVKKKSSSKRKEKVDVARGKGIELLSEVALTEETQYKEVRQKNEGTGAKPGFPNVAEEESTERSDSEHETNENESGFESDQEENEEEIEDDEQEEDDEFVKTPSNDTDDEDKIKIKDKAEGDEDEEMDYTTSQLYDDVDIRLNEPVDTVKGYSPYRCRNYFSNGYHEVPSKQTPTLLTVPVSVITESSPIYFTVIPQSIPSFTPPPPQSTTTLPPTTEATNPLSTFLDFASVFQFNNRVSTLEKDVSELKKDDPLKTQVAALVDEYLDTRLGATKILPKKVSNFAPPEIQRIVTKSLEHAILDKESSQPHSSYEAAATLIEFKLKKILIDKMDKTLFSTYGKVYSLKRSRKDKDKDEDPSAGSDRGLKKRKTSKDAEPTKGPKAKESQSGSSKGDKSQSQSSRKSVQSEEPRFEVADSDMPQDQEENPSNYDEEPKGKTPQQGPTQSWLMTLASSANNPSKTFDELMSTPIDFSAYIMNDLKISNLTQETLLGPVFKLHKGTRSNYAELEYDFEECYKSRSEKLDWENPEGGDNPFDLTKPLPLVMSRNRQKVPADYFFNNDLKYLQGGVSTMTYTTSITKTKAAQYDLPCIEDMALIIWSPVKVAYDKYALWGISHWRQQRKTFYAYARGLESRHDVYSTKCILAVTQVEVMRKHRYGYLKEIVVRRADNDLYKFKEGDFPRLCINDIEDMLLLAVQDRLTNLSGDDVSDFAIALRMFTRSLPETTKSGIRKKDPYTPYQDPQGFIYVDNKGKNRLMRSDELYKFSDRTLTGLRTSLDDITKSIHVEPQMEYPAHREEGGEYKGKEKS